MRASQVPRRLRWTVERLAIAPGDEILEIGAGPGASVSLICEQLTAGRLTAIDRSAVAIQRATERNARHVASGRAAFLQLDLAEVDLVRKALAGQSFDKAFAVNVTCPGSGQQPLRAAPVAATTAAPDPPAAQG
jgi:ubiquinone/menaquinone biosynthesis C-methylase UbiE